MRDQAAFRVEDHRIAVEDELVLAADGVDPGHEGVGIGGPGGDHLGSQQPLGGVVGRAVDVDQDLGACLGLERDRPRRVPGVLADADADPDAAKLEDRAAVAAPEVALLVEDAVVG